MVPFGWSRDEDKTVMEKELDRIAEEGVKIVKGRGTAPASNPAVTAPSNAPQSVPSPTAKYDAIAWTVEDYTTSKGMHGKLVKVGVFSAFVPEGDDAKAQAVLDTVNVIRGDKDAVIHALRAIGCNV
jgi:hypothetical protein